MVKFINKYFSDKFTPSVRYLHYLILSLVLLQIVLSNFIEISDNGAISADSLEYFSTWAHISVGLSLLLFSFIFNYQSMGLAIFTHISLVILHS